MDKLLYQNILQPLLMAINHAAPNGQIQRGFVELLHEMEEQNEPFRDIIIALVSRLDDGLRNGNWPIGR